MEAKSRVKYWLWFFVWLAIITVMLIVPDVRQFFWLALPGVCTYFALAMGIM
jgi:uncharacterized membrane protein